MRPVCFQSVVELTTSEEITRFYISCLNKLTEHIYWFISAVM